MIRRLTLSALLCALAAPAISAQETLLTREALAQDARQLARILEEAHPDPYTAFGGRIPFHRSLQELLRGLPPGGMAPQAFFEHLSPFVARLGDGHTSLRPPQGPGQIKGPGLPLAFQVVEDGLVVTTAFAPAPKELLGARLLSVEGLDLEALRARFRRLRGTENIYGELSQVSFRLRHTPGLLSLLPEWKPGVPLRTSFQLPDGSRKELALPPCGARGEATSPATRAQGLPDTSKTSLAWAFLDAEKHTAMLTIKDCGGYREAMAHWMANGVGQAKTFGQEMFKTRQGRMPMDDAELLASFPSALETFADMARAMKAAGTRTLVVDLRNNDGGNSLIAHLLVYVLHGPSGLRKLDGGYSIPRYSKLYFENLKTRSLEAMNKGRRLPLEVGDYSFEDERAFREKQGGAPDPEAWKDSFRLFPSLAGELKSPRLGGIYAPPQIKVLCNAGTYSAAFDVACALHLTGAKLVGTPSAQAANCFIDALFFKLDRSGLTGNVSYQATYGFPDDPAKGRVLPCDIPLTFEAFWKLGFDPNAELLLALDSQIR